MAPLYLAVPLEGADDLCLVLVVDELVTYLLVAVFHRSLPVCAVCFVAFLS